MIVYGDQQNLSPEGSSEPTDMQSTSLRSIPRRSPAADPGPPPTVPARSMSPAPGPQPWASTSSAKSTANGSLNRRQNVSVASSSSSGLQMHMMLTQCLPGRRIFTKQPECSPAVPDRKECNPPPCSHEATPRNPYTMVSSPSDRRAGLRCICAARLRVQHSMQSLYGHQC
jgi:hypothetical protein